jgi:two-component system, NarL family, response regulator NreC
LKGLGDSVRVVLVDDHEIFRDGLRTIIESRPGARVVGEASSVREATALLETLAFDLLILDLTMPGSNGIALLREMRRRHAPQRVLVLSMHGAADIAAEALAAGASGFALKSDSRLALLDAVDQVMRGERFVAASLPVDAIERFLEAQPSAFAAAGPLAVLSAREREVFDLLVRGYDSDAVAVELCISRRTVDTHRTHVFLKLGVHTFAELLRFGFRNRLLRDGMGDLELTAAEQPTTLESKRAR